MTGSSPAMTGEREFANVFMASSASRNIGVIKFRDEEAQGERRPDDNPFASLAKLA